MAILIFLMLFQASFPPPPPVDVPPIMEEYGELGNYLCDMGCVWVEARPDSPDPFGSKPIRRTRFTCADKTRFLMTSEDGNKHCIKLVGGK